MGWEGREGLEAFIPRDEVAVLNTSTVVHRDKWYGYGLISNRVRGPYLEIGYGLRLRLRITRRGLEGTSERVFLVSAPQSDADRPSLRLSLVEASGLLRPTYPPNPPFLQEVFRTKSERFVRLPFGRDVIVCHDDLELVA